jgi:hypothetical protein
MGHLLQPAFLGGLFIGVLSSLPIVEFGNVCCCLWVVSGGILATYLAQSNHPFPIKAAEGALIGILAGVVGAVIAFPINLVFEGWKRQFAMSLLERMQFEIPSDVRDMMESRGGGVIGHVLNLLISVVIYVIFGLLGGLLGVAMFKKDAPPPPPPGTVEVLPPQV